MSQKPQASVIALALVAGLIGGVLSSWLFTRGLPLTVPTIRAGSLHLVDDQGNYKASLMLSSNGTPILAMRDEKDQIRIMVGAGVTNSYVSLKDSTGLSQIDLRLNPSVGPHIAIMEIVGEKATKMVWKAP